MSYYRTYNWTDVDENGKFTIFEREAFTKPEREKDVHQDDLKLPYKIPENSPRFNEYQEVVDWMTVDFPNRMNLTLISEKAMELLKKRDKKENNNQWKR